MKILIIALLWLSLAVSAHAESCEPGQIWVAFGSGPPIILRVVAAVGDKTVVDYWIKKYQGWSRSQELLSCNDINLVATRVSYYEFLTLRKEEL